MRTELHFGVIGCGVDQHAIVSFISADVIGGSKPVNSEQASGNPWYPFGANNLLPQELMALIYDNPMLPELLEKKASFVVGKGIRPYMEVASGADIIPQIVDDTRFKMFHKVQHLDDVLGQLAHNLDSLGNASLEVILTKGKKAGELNVLDFTEVRCEKMSQQATIDNFYICGDWRNPRWVPENQSEGTVFKVPAFDFKDPTAQAKSIIHLRRYTLGNKYYGLPSWYGTRNWVRLQNQVPLWHLSGMKNGYNVRWHIQIPESYFDRWPDQAEKESKKTEITESLGKWLAGVENVGKAFHSYFQVNEQGNAMDGWKIEPLKFDLHDEAFTVLHEQCFQAVTSGSGINPSIAGIMGPGKMGAGSGSEMRLAYQVHVALNTTSDRRALLKAMEGIEKVEGWPSDWKYAFIDHDLSTLDKLKSGMQPVINPQN
jgi:hypothetical protein